MRRARLVSNQPGPIHAAVLATASQLRPLSLRPTALRAAPTAPTQTLEQPEPGAANRARRAPCRLGGTVYLAVSRVASDVSDPGVAAAKLRWWADELQGCAQAKAQHPATQALLRETGSAFPAHALLRLVVACEESLQHGRLLDEAALLHHASGTAGPAWEALAQVIAWPEMAAGLQALGSALRLVEIIAGLGQDIRQGRLLVPIDDLQRYGIKAHELLNASSPWPYDLRYRSLMTHQSDRARARLEAAIGALDKQARAAGNQRGKELRPARVLGALASALLDELQANGFEVLHQRIMLAPLRKWWISVRSR